MPKRSVNGLTSIRFRNCGARTCWGASHDAPERACRRLYGTRLCRKAACPVCIESDTAIENLEAVAQSFGNRPEKIDNGPDTAPSKRILKEIPEYDKVAAGVDTLELVGIDTLKEACPHFSEWVEKLVRIF